MLQNTVCKDKWIFGLKAVIRFNLCDIFSVSNTETTLSSLILISQSFLRFTVILKFSQRQAVEIPIKIGLNSMEMSIFTLLETQRVPRKWSYMSKDVIISLLFHFCRYHLPLISGKMAAAYLDMKTIRKRKEVEIVSFSVSLGEKQNFPEASLANFCLRCIIGSHAHFWFNHRQV